MKKLEQFHEKFEKMAHIEDKKKPQFNRILLLLFICILNIYNIIILTPSLLNYLYYKNTYNYEIDVWIWAPILILLSIIIEIIAVIRLRKELVKYRKRKKQYNLIKQEALIKYSIDELENDIKSKNYNDLSNTTYKFIRYSQQDISNYIKDLMGKGIQTIYYQMDGSSIKKDIALTILILIILIASRSCSKLLTDKIDIMNLTTTIADENLPDDLYEEVNFIYKKDSVNLTEEWNACFKKLKAIQNECLMHDDYERLRSYLPVYELFKQGGNNLLPLLDDEYYEIIESNDDIKIKLIAYSSYSYCKSILGDAHKSMLEDKILFRVYYDAEEYHLAFSCGKESCKQDYSISTASLNKKTDEKIYYVDTNKFTEYELAKDEWSYENVYNMLKQE